MTFECKIIELMEDEINGLENQILIANICLTKNNQEFYDLTENFTFVFSKHSDIAKEISSNPIEKFYIELNQYTLRKIQFKGIDNDFAYFHKPLLNSINEAKTHKEIEKNNISDSLNECLFSCHLEMFLYYIYFCVSSREFENHNYLKNRNIILKRYKDVISTILRVNFNLLLDNFKKLSEHEIKTIKEIYGDAIDYAEDFSKSITYFVNRNLKALDISKNIYNDKKYFYSSYIQQTAIKAFDICEKRFFFNRNSVDFFAHEFVFSDERVELKIFPTPYAFTESKKVNEAFKSNKLEEQLIIYLEKNKISRIIDENLKNQLKTKWTFSVKSILSVFYIDRMYSLNFCEFGKQNRNKLFDSLFNKGQMNLSILKDIIHSAQ